MAGDDEEVEVPYREWTERVDIHEEDKAHLAEQTARSSWGLTDQECLALEFEAGEVFA